MSLPHGKGGQHQQHQRAERHREERGGLKIGALTTIAQVAENPLVKKLYPGLARAAMEVGKPAASCPGDDRREYLPEASLLVLPGRLSLHTQGRRHMFCPRRREPVPLHLRRCCLLYRPPVGHGPCFVGSSGRGSHRGPQGFEVHSHRSVLCVASHRPEERDGPRT